MIGCVLPSTMYSAIFVAVLVLKLSVLPASCQSASQPSTQMTEPIVAAQCSFPAFLTTRQIWESRISLSRSIVGMIWKFGSDAAQVTDVTASSVMLYNCIDSASMDDTGNTVLVRVAPSTPSSYNDLNNGYVASATSVIGYQCFRFVQRSQYVVQVWKSTVSSTVSPAVRLCDQLVLDQFPLVYSSLDGENSNTPASQLVPTDENNVGGTGCALSGGYRFMLQPAEANASDTGSILCSEIPLSPIMESDCGCTEGQPSISIDFRQWFCAGRLGIPLVSTVHCIGSWSDPSSNYVFSIVADASKTRSTLWLFRWPLPVPGRQAFVGHVSTQISTATDAKMTPSSSTDVSYAVHMTPTTYSDGLCNDEVPASCNSAICMSNITAADALPGLSLTKTSCQQTCGTCVKDSGNFSNCQLTGSSVGLVGSWLEVSRNSKRQRTITVGPRSINFASDSSTTSTIANCLNFSTGQQSIGIGQRFPVVTVFPSTGCRTRYACIELTQRSQSVMTYRVGRALLWPYVPSISFPSQLGANMLCSDSMFQTSSTSAFHWNMLLPNVNYLDMSHEMRAVIKIPSTGSGQLWPVNCGLPGASWLLLDGQLANGDSLSATIDQCSINAGQYMFRYALSASGVTETHQCLAAYVDSDTEDRYIITMKQTDDIAASADESGSENYFCWMFQRRALYGVPNQVFLTSASDCNANTGLRVRSMSFGGYIASFQLVMPPDTGMSTGLFGSALPVVRSCVTFDLPTVVTTPSASSQRTTLSGKSSTKVVSAASTTVNPSKTSPYAGIGSTVSSTPGVVSPSRTSSSNDYSSRSSIGGDDNQMLSTSTTKGYYNTVSAGQSTVYKKASRTVTVLAIVVTSLTAVLSTSDKYFY